MKGYIFWAIFFTNSSGHTGAFQFNITAYESQEMSVEVLEFAAEPPPRGSGPWIRPQSPALGQNPEHFNAIYVKPVTLSGRYIPLVVDIHDGPHMMSSTDFQVTIL
jgi:hypothetical protein